MFPASPLRAFTQTWVLTLCGMDSSLPRAGLLRFPRGVGSWRGEPAVSKNPDSFIPPCYRERLLCARPGIAVGDRV